jgi:O-antigen/teichoic acid export membrane protein
MPEAVLAMLIAPVLPILSEAYGKADHSTFRRALLFNFLLSTLIIVPISLVQAAAPALTLLPFGAEYKGHPDIVLWLMVHALMYALMFPAGSILISMGKMWFSLWLNVVFAVSYGISAWLLVPRYGGAGYAASTVIGYALSCIPCVVFFYRKLPDVMRFLRWGLLLAACAVLFAVCAFASCRLPTFSAAAVGAATAFVFLALKYHLYAASASKASS